MRLDVYSDFVCPWCWLGRHRLKLALAMHRGRAPILRYRPFQLNPEIGPGGVPRDVYLVAKFGSIERAAQVHALVEQAAERDGLALNLAQITVTPPTLDAHRLIDWAIEEAGAAKPGDIDLLIDGLFSAYLVDGRDIGDTAVLIDIAQTAGYDADAARAYLADGAGESAVRTADLTARRLGIQAVPCFVFNRQHALAGAHEPETFLPLLDLATIDDARHRLAGDGSA